MDAAVLEPVWRAALAALELDPSHDLERDTLAACEWLRSPAFRIAVFAPFNHGKSTLLNALLGRRTLPIDIIPTTGAAIRIAYGDTLRCRVTLSDGAQVESEGTEALKTYAILDDRRRMRADVRAVEVFCPDPFLQTGVEYVDLPGTDDREAQEQLVKDRLLTADLVVQVLDARKVMTLAEREQLYDWLVDRGIETVVFVVNFANLLEPEEQQAVQKRLRFLAESFRSHLPPGTSNLYRVDALPALRGRLRGEAAVAQASGLAAFESALQAIAAARQNLSQSERVASISRRLHEALETKIADLERRLGSAGGRQQRRSEVMQKAATLIERGLQRSSSELQGWIYLPVLESTYRQPLTAALLEGTFELWEADFRDEVLYRVGLVQEWGRKAAEFFQQPEPTLAIALPGAPQVVVEEPEPSQSASTPAAVSSSDDDILPVAAAAGLGFLFGGPIGAAVAGGASYVLRRRESTGSGRDRAAPPPVDPVRLRRACDRAAANYLAAFSTDAFVALSAFESAVRSAIRVPAPDSTPQQDPALVRQLQHLRDLAAALSV